MEPSHLSTKELPNFETLRFFAARYPDLDFGALEACVYLHRLTTDLTNAFDQHFARFDLSKGRFMILVMLMRQSGSGLAPAELAEACGVTRATVTGLLDTLESAGLVARVQKSDDRRSVEIQLTAKGQEHMDKMLPEHYRRVAGLMSQLSRDERTTLTTLLGKVAQCIGTVRDP
jgi:DNA-binding MarR family transcriptional regulator